MTTSTAFPALADEAAAPGTHDVVLQTLLQYRPSLQGRSILDIPCGRGSFSRRLQQQGAEVSAVDIALNTPFLFERDRLFLGNANEGLAFPDGNFDVVVSIEGVEHFENPSFFMREIFRVLKPGGVAVVSTPNVNSLWSRWESFRRGFHCHFQPTGDTEKASGHLLPIDAVFLRGAAERAGLTFLGTVTNAARRKTPFWEWLEPRLQKRQPAWVRNSCLAYGDVAIFVFEKTATVQGG